MSGERSRQLLGRQRSLQELDRLSYQAPIILVFGAAGIGKTTLVREWMASSGRLHLELDLGTVGAPRAALHELLLVKPAEAPLLFLDSAEEHLEWLLPELAKPAWAADERVIIVASRIRTARLTAEQVEITPLTAREGAKVFQRELAARPAGRMAQPPEAQLVEELVGLLGGLPRAIERAAEQARFFSIRELVDGLRSPHASLTHRWLSSNNEAQYRAVSARELQLFYALVLFEGEFDYTDIQQLAAAEGIEEQELPSSLTQLIDASLVRQVVDTSGWVSFSIYRGEREFALQRLEQAGRLFEAYRAHAEHLLRRVGPDFMRGYWAGGAQVSEGLGRLGVELSFTFERLRKQDVVLAARVLAVLKPTQLAQGSIQTHRQRLKAVLAELPERELELRCRLSLDYALSLFLCADLTRANIIFKEIIRVAEERGLSELLIEARTYLLFPASFQGEMPNESEASLLDAPLGRLALATVAIHRGDLGGCCEHCRAGLSLAMSAGDRSSEGRLRAVLGLALMEQGFLAQAQANFSLAKEALELSQDSYFQGVTSLWEGQLQQDLGDYEAAERLLRESQRRLEEAGDRIFAASSHGYLAISLISLGKIKEAIAEFELALIEARQHQDIYRLGFFLPAYAVAAELEGDHTSSAALMAELEALPIHAVNPNLSAIRELALANLALIQAQRELQAGHAATALEGFNLAAEIRGRVRAPRSAAFELGEPSLSLVPIHSISSDVRFLLRWLEDRLECVEGQLKSKPTQPVRVLVEPELVVAELGYWFRVEAEPAISLLKRHTLRRVFWHLVSSHLERPGSPSSTQTIFEAGWPNTRCAPQAASHRVHVAIATLRQLGLSPWLVKYPGGYALVPQTRLQVLSAAQEAPV